MKELYLIANAHIDPVWQWERTEGIGVAISTFSAVADLLEEDDSLIFNHNEAVLYQWVESYAPELFERIRRLVSCGRWHIMGGWYLQPDCNMPSGESLVRQILAGRLYFREKFGQNPTVAVNFDSFGHSDGLVQILEDTGYIGYICVRPQTALETRDCVWNGFHGTSILLHRATDGYSSLLGRVGEKLPYYEQQFKKTDREMLLWGVGNHGGGPSRADLKFLNRTAAERPELGIRHSDPETYFEGMAREELPVMEGKLNYFMQGCYTSQVRIKQGHRKLENELYLTEKMCCHACAVGMEYPTEALDRAEKDLLFSEFHDILPGSSIKQAEDAALAMIGHGLEELSQLKAQAFFRLCGGQNRAGSGEFPILVYNPHPFKVRRRIVAEFMLADQNWSTETFWLPVVRAGDEILPSQPEKESSNIPLDWRKRVVFEAELEPSSMNRFDCRPELTPVKACGKTCERDGTKSVQFVSDNGEMRFELCPETGYPGRYEVGGRDFLGEGFSVDVIRGSCDPWGFYFDANAEKLGGFELMTREDAGAFLKRSEPVNPIRMIEDGEVRRVFESLFRFRESKLVIRYTVPKRGTEVELDLTLFNDERDCIVKLNIPAAFSGQYLGRTVFGVDKLPTDGTETVAQDYTMLTDGDRALSVVNFGTYGSSSDGGGIRMTLVNSAAYTAHPVEDRVILREDRFNDRIDLGERKFRFVLSASEAAERNQKIERENLVCQQEPFVLSYFPTGEGECSGSMMTLDDPRTVISCCKRSADGKDYILRIFNGSPETVTAHLNWPDMEISDRAIEFGDYQFRTFRINRGTVSECNAIEDLKQ